MTTTLPSAPSTHSRFTLDGSEELERHLSMICANVLAGIRAIVPEKKFEALLLGGGYGRGEGGVLETPAGHQPYNDLEFYVQIRGNRWLNERRYGRPLHELAHRLGDVAGIEVEFKILSGAQLRQSPPSMFYYDLLAGHKLLWGEMRVPARSPHRSANSIPLSEATRLLMNRGTGLLFAQETLKTENLSSAEIDFVTRNLAKMQLALGDAVLTVFGQYHWSCRERHERLARLQPVQPISWLPEVVKHHAHGVEFKLRPHQTHVSVFMLHRQFAELSTLLQQAWLWVESMRLNIPFGSVREYALSGCSKCPETNRWRNCLVNAKLFGPAALLEKKPGRYPRERLFHALPVLLWEGPQFDEELKGQLRNELKAEGDFIWAYQDLSARLNGSARPVRQAA